METIFMNTENSIKTNETHRFRLTLADKLNFKNQKKIWHRFKSLFDMEKY